MLGDGGGYCESEQDSWWDFNLAPIIGTNNVDRPQRAATTSSQHIHINVHSPDRLPPQQHHRSYLLGSSILPIPYHDYESALSTQPAEAGSAGVYSS